MGTYLIVLSGNFPMNTTMTGLRGFSYLFCFIVHWMKVTSAAEGFTLSAHCDQKHSDLFQKLISLRICLQVTFLVAVPITQALIRHRLQTVSYRHIFRDLFNSYAKSQILICILRYAHQHTPAMICCCNFFYPFRLRDTLNVSSATFIRFKITQKLSKS